jgi:protein phosphatase
MGGHAAGREASELALSTMLEAFDAAPEGAGPAHVLRAAIEDANRRVHAMDRTSTQTGRPGSTVVAVLMHPAGTEVAHVGDSRALLVHAGQIYRMTRDHSVVEEMVRRGLLAPDRAPYHPDANRITRALGMASEVEVELRAQPVVQVAGDTFVLCSDGLSDMVEDQDILRIVASEPPAQAVGRLVDLANARGGHDNVTVAVLRARQGALVSTGPVAPTQTGAITEPPDTVPTPPPVMLAPAPPSPRATIPAYPLAEAALVPPHPDSSQRPVRRRSPTVLVSIALAAVGVALLAGAVLAHLAGSH